jgi:hypothetical protein
MSKTNLPGFTAEASLYSRGGHHYVAEGAVPMIELGLQAVFLSQATGGRTGEQRTSGGGWQCWYIWGCFICCTSSWCWYICRVGAASFNGAAIQ